MWRDAARAAGAGVALAGVLTACASANARTVEELSLHSKDAQLSAVLHLPSSRGPHPAVVLVHGSGRLEASDMLRNAPPLMEMGLAVLAYDKRGVGRSTGHYASIGPKNSVEMFDLLSADALAAVDALTARRDIDPRRIGLFGISQGGWIAPLAASRSRDVAFVVTLSGPAVSVGEEIAYSNLAGEDPGSIQGLSEEEINKRLQSSTIPHGYDPKDALTAMTVPSLWILGANDRSIPLANTIANLTRIKQTHGRPITTHVIPGANHGLRRTDGDRPDFWRVIRTWLEGERIIRKN